MTIDLQSIFDRSCPLGLLEMVFQDSEILKFSGGSMPPGLSPLVKSRFGEIYKLESLSIAYFTSIITV